jgi:nifR3 family TIM-barrel protein
LAPNFYQRKLAEGRAILAPMAGFTDAPFRRLCREYGSAWAVTEMVSAKGVLYNPQRSFEIGEPYPDEPDLVIQIFGGDPAEVAAGAHALYQRYRPQAIDLNMGCPVKKVTGKSCGAKLMLEPDRAAKIIRAMAAALPIPVSAKLRLGYDRVNVLEVAQALEAAGASLIAVHGRTAAQKYTGEANWEMICALAERLSIPVVGSGDVATRAQFVRYRELGLGVMVARAAIGRPWLFAELMGQPAPSEAEKAQLAFRHALDHVAWYQAQQGASETQLVQKFRGQLLRYFAGYPAYRPRLCRVASLSELADLIDAMVGVDISKANRRSGRRTNNGEVAQAGAALRG